MASFPPPPPPNTHPHGVLLAPRPVRPRLPPPSPERTVSRKGRPRHLCLEVSPTECNGTYSQERVRRLAGLAGHAAPETWP